jgi:hypothetical protein
MKATLDAIDHSDYELDLVGGQVTSSVTRQPSLAVRWLYIAGCKHTNRRRTRPNWPRASLYLEHETGLAGGLRPLCASRAKLGREPATPTLATCSDPWIPLRFPAKPPQEAALDTRA